MTERFADQICPARLPLPKGEGRDEGEERVGIAVPYYIDVNPDQSNGTQEGMRVASRIKVALDSVIDYLTSKAKRGERLQSHDLEAVRELINKKISSIES